MRLAFLIQSALRHIRKKTDQFRSRLAAIDTELKDAEARFAEADNCIRIFARIDAEHGIDVSGVMKRYEEILHGNYGLQKFTEQSNEHDTTELSR